MEESSVGGWSIQINHTFVPARPEFSPMVGSSPEGGLYAPLPPSDAPPALTTLFLVHELSV